MSCNPTPECLVTAAGTAIAAMFTDTVLVRRATAVQSDLAGGRKPTSGDGWTTVTTTPGLLQTTRFIRANERTIGDKIMAPAPYAVYLPTAIEVRTEDRLVIGTRTFEVGSISKAESTAVIQRVNCIEFQPQP